MTISLTDLDDIITNKKNTTIKKINKNRTRIYLTKIQYDYLKLIRDITKLNFIKEKELRQIVINIIDKKNLDENTVSLNKNKIMEILKTRPIDLYTYIESKSSFSYQNLYNLRNTMVPKKNLNCLICNNLSIKFNYCKEHYDQQGKKNLSDTMNYISLHANNKYTMFFLNILTRELVDNIKLLEKYQEQNYDLEIKINRIDNILEYANKYHDKLLHNLILDFISYNNKDLRKHYKFINKQENEKHSDFIAKKITHYIKNNNLSKINSIISPNIKSIDDNDNNISFLKINKIIIIENIKKNLNFIERYKRFLDSLLNMDPKYDDNMVLVLNSINIKNFIDFELSDESDNISIRHKILEFVFNSKFQIQNLSYNKFFEDHYYNNNFSLTYDIYGEIYNFYHKKYIPFIININNIMVTANDIKNFYCFINNIPYLVHNNNFNKIMKFLEYISIKENFFLGGII